MNTANATSQSADSRQKQTELQNRYGRIAISAVVAALPYRSEPRNPTNAPVEARD